MKAIWFGHSAFRLEFGSSVVLIDPFLTGNPSFKGDVGEASAGATHILITHGHGDHVGDALKIAADTGAKVVTNYDLSMWLASQGLKSFDPMNTGGTTDQGEFSVTLVRADHSAGMGEAGVNVPLGSANGIVITPKIKGEPVVWHCGDTDIFSDMKLICQIHKPKVALVPIGDRFTMGVATAAMAVKKFMPGVKTVAPTHYASFPPLAPDAKAFIRAARGAKAKVIAPAAGEPFVLK
ncbi:metal-dependent hydrolase [Terrarubrum flagellatum]|uniref:metal-dependent hydrolase n=1 Tax=Terrirubrum flagellatum TaxID=2895980 RepID=UPI00314512BC